MTGLISALIGGRYLSRSLRLIILVSGELISHSESESNKGSR